MASFKYNGDVYFNTGGHWVDGQSKAVSKELAEELNKLYSHEEIEKRNRAQKLNQKSANYSELGYTPRFFSNRKNNENEYNNKSMLSKPISRNPVLNSVYNNKNDLTSEQERALELMESGANIFLSGEAGTGKSYVLNEFIKRNKDKNVLICAPTGVAAINVGGATIHRVFKAPLGVIRPYDNIRRPEEDIIYADIVVIDEISMCRIDLFEYVIRTIRKAQVIRQDKENKYAEANGRNPKMIRPKQIIVVGDFYQLAPVLTTREKETLYEFWDREIVGEGYAFQSELWTELNFQSVILKDIVRQNDIEYIRNLNKIRVGDESGLEWFNKNIRQVPISRSIYLCGTNAVVKEINEEEADKLPGEFTVYRSTIRGQVGDGDKMTSDELKLKVGMQVMTVANNFDEGYQNGSIGKVEELSKSLVTVRLNNGRLVNVVPYEWEIYGYEVLDEKVEKMVIGTFRQIPLKIAYAITIHKSQGQTYDSVNISPDCFLPGQLYVALSRAKTIEGISLEHLISLKALQTSPIVQDFYKSIKECTVDFAVEKEVIKSNDEQKSKVDYLPPEKDYVYTPDRLMNLYDKVQGMTLEEINSCKMYQSVYNNPNAYTPWTREEEEQLLDEVASGMKTSAIAKTHQRTNGAIRSRLKKIRTYNEGI